MPVLDDAPDTAAGFLLWYCGGRACAIVYARVIERPDVAAILVARTERPYLRQEA